MLCMGIDSTVECSFTTLALCFSLLAHPCFCADQRHPRAASGPHAIFCAEKSALKKNSDSMQCIFVKDSRHTFRIYAYSNLANCKFTLVQ